MVVVVVEETVIEEVDLSTRNNAFLILVVHLGFDRRGLGAGNRNNDRNGSSYGNNTNPRPSRFSNKRSRSRSPPVRQSRFDNDSSDFKRPRTDHSRPSHVSLDSTYFISHAHLHFRMNLLDNLIPHQRMAMLCILNDPFKNLNRMDYHHHHPLQQVILIVDSSIKRTHHIQLHRRFHPLIQYMVNRLNSPRSQQVHHHPPRRILCFRFMNSFIL